MSEAEQARGSHGKARTRPIRQRIALLLALPLATLIALWAFAMTITLSAALERDDYTTVYEQAGLPALDVTSLVQAERAAAVAVLTMRDTTRATRYQQAIAATDKAVAAFRKTGFAADTTGAMDANVRQRLGDLNRSFGVLGVLRAQVNGQRITPVAAIDAYGAVNDGALRMLTTLVSVDDVAVYQQSTALLYSYWSRDFMLREDALISALRPGGRVGVTTRAAFARWAGSREELFKLGNAPVRNDIATILKRVDGSVVYGRYSTLEARFAKEGLVPDQADWRAQMATLSPLWMKSISDANAVLRDKLMQPAIDSIMTRFYIAGVAGLAGVILSIVLSLLFARRIAAELRRLQNSAQHLAHEQLPRVVARLRRGERVDVDAEAPRPATGKTREIASVADAFSAVQRTAVGTAVGESELRASINRVFINLSWRSQSLLHRQLRLLDQMERRASSPEELDDLFRLDHLTTRMRRHAEGLVILSGSPTVRAWDHPVAAEDVVRAAIAEVEDYTRIEVVGVTAAAVSGAVVADVIHLLAELIENAASFSPPTTEVTVRVETVANGLAVEVVDRGVGLHPEELDELNRRVSQSVEFDLVDTDRLGLFVVSRLAARHGIQVKMQPSAYGGTTVIVLIPHKLVVVDEDWHPPALEAADAGQGGGHRLGRPARPALAGPAAGMSAAMGGAPAYVPQAEPSAAPAAPAAPVAAPEYVPPTEPPVPAAGPPAPLEPLAPSRTSGAHTVAGGAHARPEEKEEHIETDTAAADGKLPRRVRQRNLAPQLRDRPAAPAPGGHVDEADDDFDEPSPELSRDLMASLQSGWLRGRDTGTDAGEPGAHEEWGES
ncbi:sensor histidine kinase [Spirillospora albida]|uniref:sensor histidine kinase n=1 Tax=Spirillospora albida TaxID=58123 RepID=UPI0004BF5DFD|nr:sensor histidine kinase [Spirillospora albida]